MTKRFALALWLLAGLALTPDAGAIFVTVEFFASAPLSGWQLWAWAEGSDLPNHEVDRAVRAAVEQQLAKKGYMKVEGKPDFWMVIETRKDELFSGGEVRIEALDGESREVMWRGKAEGVIGTDKVKRRIKEGERAVRKMFKQFPGRVQ